MKPELFRCGHPKVADNMRRDGGRWRCRQCNDETCRAWRAARKAKGLATHPVREPMAAQRCLLAEVWR